MAAPSPMSLTEVCGASPSWACRTAFDRTGSDLWAHAFEWLVAIPATILAVVVAASVANLLVRRAIGRGVDRMSSSPGALGSSVMGGVPQSLRGGQRWVERREARAQTLGSVLRSIASIGVWTTAGFVALGVANINLGPFVAGAGIAGIAIGFGAQSFVKDVVTGIFMLAEDQYGVGDIVDLGEAKGTVEKVSIRATRLRDVYGVVWYVPNGEIRRVANKSQEWARALVDVTVAYDTDAAEAGRVILEAARAVVAQPRWHGEVLEEPEVWGIEDFGPTGMTIRLVVKTRPSVQFSLMRELRARLKTMLDEAGIVMAFDQAAPAQAPAPAPTPAPGPPTPSAPGQPG